MYVKVLSVDDNMDGISIRLAHVRIDTCVCKDKRYPVANVYNSVSCSAQDL